MRFRSALLVTCLTGAAGAVAAAAAIHAQSPKSPAATASPAPPAPYGPMPMPAPPPSAPLPPRRPMPPEVRDAIAEARLTEAFTSLRRYDEAIENYRRSIAAPPAAEAAAVAEIRSVHLSVLAAALIRGGRPDDADRLLAAYLADAPPLPADPYMNMRRMQLSGFAALRIYIAAGKGDVPDLLARLDEWKAITSPSGLSDCIDPPLMPMAVAPMHRNPAVRARLIRLGCSEDVIDQIDRLAAEPIDPPYFLPAPGRRGAGPGAAPQSEGPAPSGAGPLRPR
jgi:tetratricopeptide (TPR) repeat protein